MINYPMAYINKGPYQGVFLPKACSSVLISLKKPQNQGLTMSLHNDIVSFWIWSLGPKFKLLWCLSLGSLEIYVPCFLTFIFCPCSLKNWPFLFPWNKCSFFYVPQKAWEGLRIIMAVIVDGDDDIFVWFDSLRHINNLSVKQGQVFLGWTSTELGFMCLAQGPQHSDAGEARTRGPSVSSQALYYWATVLPRDDDIEAGRFNSRRYFKMLTDEMMLEPLVCFMITHEPLAQLS